MFDDAAGGGIRALQKSCAVGTISAGGARLRCEAEGVRGGAAEQLYDFQEQSDQSCV